MEIIKLNSTSEFIIHRNNYKPAVIWYGNGPISIYISDDDVDSITFYTFRNKDNTQFHHGEHIEWK